MTRKLSKLLSDNPDEPFFELNAQDPSNPPRTRICSAWETINSAVDDLPPNDQVMALLEISRRADVRANNIMQNLKREAIAKRLTRERELPFRSENDS